MSLPTIRTSLALFVTLLTVTSATPAAAQSKEQRQMMADLRMLQEQNQTLQNVLGSIVEAIKAVNARIDDQAKVTGKAMADQKLVIDNLTNNVREIREKLDDNNVRLGSLNQEVEALRQGIQQLNATPPAAVTSDSGAAPGTGDAAAAPPALPDAYYKKGIALKSLKQPEAARAAFEYVVKTYPDSSAATLARQQITQPARQN